MQQRWRTILAIWTPVIAWYGLITYLSHQPKLPGPEDSWWAFVWFKTAHLIVYALLGWFSLLAWHVTTNWSLRDRRLLILVASFVFMLAALDEWHQSFIPGRGPHVRDVLIDLVGAGAVLWSASRYNRFTPLLVERAWRKIRSRAKQIAS